MAGDLGRFTAGWIRTLGSMIGITKVVGPVGFEDEAVARAFYNLTKLYARGCHFWKGRMLDSVEVEKKQRPNGK
jgi:hypothetical protein